MKKLSIVWILASLFALSAVWTGCSSKPVEQPKEQAEAPLTMSQAQAVESPVNLGASSSGVAR